MQDGLVGETNLVGVLWRRKWWLTLLVLVGAGLGYGLSQFQPVRYTAESRVFLSSAAAFDPLGQRSVGNQDRYVVQQAALMSSQPVLARVIPPASLKREDLMEAIDVTASADSDLVVVRATAGTGADAAALADAVAVAFQEYTGEQVAQTAAAAVAAVSDEDQAEQIRAAAAVYGDGVALVDNAVVPTSPSQPAPLRNAVLLAVLTGLVGAVVAVVSDGRRLRRPALPAVADSSPPGTALPGTSAGSSAPRTADGDHRRIRAGAGADSGGPAESPLAE